MMAKPGEQLCPSTRVSEVSRLGRKLVESLQYWHGMAKQQQVEVHALRSRLELAERKLQVAEERNGTFDALLPKINLAIERQMDGLQRSAELQRLADELQDEVSKKNAQMQEWALAVEKERCIRNAEYHGDISIICDWYEAEMQRLKSNLSSQMEQVLKVKDEEKRQLSEEFQAKLHKEKEAWQALRKDYEDRVIQLEEDLLQADLFADNQRKNSRSLKKTDKVSDRSQLDPERQHPSMIAQVTSTTPVSSKRKKVSFVEREKPEAIAGGKTPPPQKRTASMLDLLTFSQPKNSRLSLPNVGAVGVSSNMAEHGNNVSGHTARRKKLFTPSAQPADFR